MFMNIYEQGNSEKNIMELVIDNEYYFSRCRDLSSMEAIKVVREYFDYFEKRSDIPSIGSIFMDRSTNQVKIVLTK